MSGTFRRRLARQDKIAKETLDGLPYEKFLRILGWFHTMVPVARKQRKADGTYLDPIVREFDKIRVLIEEKRQQEDLRFQRDELGGQVHNLNLIIGKLLTVEALEVTVPSFRDDYRMRVTAETYAAYTGSAPYKALNGCVRTPDAATRLRLLQADFIQLVNEIRRLTLLEYHIEETRTYLIRKLRRTLYKLLIAPTAIILLYLILRLTWGAGNLWPLFNVSVLATLLSLAAIAGAVGSFVSALLRVAAVPESNEVGRSVVALRDSESIRLAPVTGFIFAILLSFIFGGQLLTGILFPKTEGVFRWPELLFYPPELAKWMVWAFIVGFAERLMPDMIDRMVIKAGKPTEVAVAPAQSNGIKPLVIPEAPAGANGKVRHRAVTPPRLRPTRRKVRA
jgi:hypothetical protein